jgi:2'-5' RNA ligase
VAALVAAVRAARPVSRGAVVGAAAGTPPAVAPFFSSDASLPVRQLPALVGRLLEQWTAGAAIGAEARAVLAHAYRWLVECVLPRAMARPASRALVAVVEAWYALEETEGEGEMFAWVTSLLAQTHALDAASAADVAPGVSLEQLCGPVVDQVEGAAGDLPAPLAAEALEYATQTLALAPAIPPAIPRAPALAPPALELRVERSRAAAAAGAAGAAPAAPGSPRPEGSGPNFFVAVRLRAPEVWRALDDAQAAVVDALPALRSCVVRTSDLHVTLGRVLALHSERDVAEACRVLEGEREGLQAAMAPAAAPHVAVRLEGLSRFDDRVLFAAVAETPALACLREVVRRLDEAFEHAGLLESPARGARPWQPHATIMKASKWRPPRAEDAARGRRPPPIPVPTAFATRVWGDVRVEAVELLAMRERARDGFYRAYARVPLVRGADALT